MQVCTSLQTNSHASTPPLSFYRPDALLPPSQQRQSTENIYACHIGRLFSRSRRPAFPTSDFPPVRYHQTVALLGKGGQPSCRTQLGRFIAGGDGDVGGHIGGARSAPCHVTCSGSSSSRREASAATDYGLYPEGVVRRFSAVNIRRFYTSPTYLLTYSLSRCPSASECNAESDSVLSQTLESCPINKLDGSGRHSASPLR